MSRSGYSDDFYDNWELIRWRGAVASAINGKRGQAFLRELLAALDAMPSKRLIADELISQTGEVCALGAVAKSRCMDVSDIILEDPVSVAKAFGISQALAAEVEFMNDDDFAGSHRATPESRWWQMRGWVADQIKAPAP